LNSHDRTKAMVESALITALAVVFALAGIYIPLLGYALFFLPVPFIIIGAKHGIKYNILAIIAASVIIGSMTEPLRALFIIIVVGFNSVVIGYMVEKNQPVGRTMFFGSIASIVASILSIAFVSYLANANVVKMIEDTFTISNEIYESLFKNMGSDPEKIQEAKQLIDHAKNMAIMLLPSSVIFASVAATYINYLASGAILRRMGYTINKPKRFSYFRLPKNILMGTGIILILTYFIKSMNIVDYETLFSNVLYIFFIVYLIQGLAVTSFFMEKKGIGRAVKIIIIFIILTIPSAAMILMFLGLADVVFNIRKL